jgi:hypothetical protein
MANSYYQNQRKYHIVYKTTNTVNGNIYVGAHSTDDLDDGYLGSGDNISRAIKKYGRDKFVKEILHHLRDPIEMFNLESEIVTEDFIKRKDVYNIVPGGYGGANKGSTGLKHLHNPITKEYCAVHQSAVPKMLEQGWVVGRGYSSTTGTIWIHRDGEKKMILPDLLDEHINQGWCKGLPKSPTSGKKWIFNPLTEEYSLCEENELESKMATGWIKKKWSPVKKGSTRIFNPLTLEYLRCDINELQNKLNDGWQIAKNHIKRNRKNTT